MSALNVSPNLTQHDDLYQKLVEMHEGLSPDDSLKLWARLTLILMNHVGDAAVLQDAIATARKG